MLEQIKVWDRELFLWLNGLGIETYDSFWIFITQVETWTPLFVLLLIVIIRYYRWKKGLAVIGFMLLALGLTFLFTDLTKELVGRLRPNNSEPLSQLVRILQRPTDYSFFSGHASSSFVITTFVFLSVRKFNKWILLAYLWPLLFVVSRIYVGVHYPSDIIAGALAGVLVAFLFYYISKVILNRI